MFPAVLGETCTRFGPDQFLRLEDSHTTIDRLPFRPAAPQSPLLPNIFRSVAMIQNFLPSLDRMMVGSRAPLVPTVEVRSGRPRFTSVQLAGLLPLLTAREIFSPSAEPSPVNLKDCQCPFCRRCRPGRLSLHKRRHNPCMPKRQKPWTQRAVQGR